MTLPAPKYYWTFNETSGTTATDSVGGAKMAIDRESFVPGRWGNGLRFNPQSGARLATTTLPELPPPWTATFWVKREADSEAASLFSSLKYALKLEQWEDTHAVGISRFGVKDHQLEYRAPVGQWVHLTFVGTSTETRLYADGRPEGRLPESIRPGLQWIGSTQGRDELASMILGDLVVFDEALTDDQVTELHRASSTRTAPGRDERDRSLDGARSEPSEAPAGAPRCAPWPRTRSVRGSPCRSGRSRRSSAPTSAPTRAPTRALTPGRRRLGRARARTEPKQAVTTWSLHSASASAEQKPASVA